MKKYITNEIYLDYLNCKYKADLKVRGFKGKKSEYEKIETRFASRYRKNAILYTGEKYRKKAIDSHIPFENLLKSDLDIAYDIKIKGEDYCICYDAIFVVSLSKPEHIPVLFIHREKVKIVDKMSLVISVNYNTQMATIKIPEI